MQSYLIVFTIIYFIFFETNELMHLPVHAIRYQLVQNPQDLGAFLYNFS